MRLSRRAALAGALASFATGGLAQAPATSLRPVARIPVTDPAARLIAQAGLSGQVGCVVADRATGAVLEAVLPDVPLPPASVTKAVTALYALENLGSGFRFDTRVLAQGIINNGILDGNLILAGGGDPNLVTDQMALLAADLKATGLREVRGDFLVWDNALANLDEIDPTQLDYAGYNPTITGLNLNFNRVHFAWKRQGAGYDTAVDARSDSYRPPVSVADVQIVDRDLPVFAHRAVDGVDRWTVARSALGNGGSRWLPVRNPARYAGEVFAYFARAQGIVLQPPREIQGLPAATEVARLSSAPLPEMMRDMLNFSTNITAEAAGLAATARRAGQAGGLAGSAAEMAAWLRARAGVSATFVDHSGLGDASRLSAGQMVRFLLAPDVAPVLQPLMKDIALLDENRRAIRNHPGRVRAKTGTLDFVSTLAGYVTTAVGRDLTFAFFAADIGARARAKAAGNEVPAGAVAWNRDAKALQQRMLQHWITRGA